MTDRELLELAAKAAGIEYDITCTEKDYSFGLWLTIHGEPYEGQRRKWNPLTDDGDALRLAVKLRMRIATPTTDTDCAIAGCGDVRGVHVKAYSEDEITDIYAATRRAITRAAAEIGRAMP